VKKSGRWMKSEVMLFDSGHSFSAFSCPQKVMCICLANFAIMLTDLVIYRVRHGRLERLYLSLWSNVPCDGEIPQANLFAFLIFPFFAPAPTPTVWITISWFSAPNSFDSRLWASDQRSQEKSLDYLFNSSTLRWLTIPQRNRWCSRTGCRDCRRCCFPARFERSCLKSPLKTL
jgi:hypothetical protein